MTMFDWLASEERYAEKRFSEEDEQESKDYLEGKRDAFHEALNFLVAEAEQDITLKELHEHCMKYKMCTRDCKFNAGGHICTLTMPPCNWDVPEIERRVRGTN